MLLVEDDALLRSLVGELVTELGFLVLEARDGDSALACLASEHAIELLVTDIGIPGTLNGYALAANARLSRPDLKVLFITGYADRTTLDAMPAYPRTEMLYKPFSMRDLSAKLQSLKAHSKSSKE